MDEQLKAEARRLHEMGLSAQQIANRLAIDVAPVWRTLYAGTGVSTENTVEHETWLEYHDRLVREYFDGERELLKEIYPDRQKTARRHRPVNALHGVALAYFGVATVQFFVLDNVTTTVIWIAMALAVLVAATITSRR